MTTVPREEAFSIFESWKSRKSALYVTGPLERAFGEGEGRRSGKVVDVDSLSDRLTVLIGTPETGQQEIRFVLTGASYAAAPGTNGESVCLTVQLSPGDMVFFVEKTQRNTGCT